MGAAPSSTSSSSTQQQQQHQPRQLPGGVPNYKKPIERCLCHGTQPNVSPVPVYIRNGVHGRMNDDKVHPVWIGFLHKKNDQYETQRWLQDYWCLNMNALTTWWSGRPFVHCQIAFWCAATKKYYTYSVDQDRGVWAWDDKEFAAGWEWIKLMVTERCEVSMHNFLQAQLGKQMNSLGQFTIVTCCKASGNERRWFCSELMTAALINGGIIVDNTVVPHEQWPHTLYDHLLQYCAYTPRPELMTTNPVRLIDFHKRLETSDVRIDIPVSGLPKSLAVAFEERHGSGRVQQQQQQPPPLARPQQRSNSSSTTSPLRAYESAATTQETTYYQQQQQQQRTRSKIDYV